MARPEQCAYCGAVSSLPRGDLGWQEHMKVHKILRHQIIPGKYRGNVFSAVRGVKTTLQILTKL